MSSGSKKKQRVFEAAHYHTTIKQWPEGERPREKLLHSGAAALSEAELLAILIRTGTKGATAVDLAKKLLASGQSLRDLARMSALDIEQLGIGRTRAVTIVAAFELMRRLPTSDGNLKPTFRTPNDVVNRFGPRLRDLKHEEFWVLLLNAANHLLRDVKISSGTLDSSLVHPRECFHDAIKEKAASVIFLHNHPSGNAEPSREDLSITKQLVEAGKVLGIPVHDHIIIAGGGFTSFAERGLL